MFYTPPSRFAPPTYPRKKLPTAADQPPQPQAGDSAAHAGLQPLPQSSPIPQQQRPPSAPPQNLPDPAAGGIPRPTIPFRPKDAQPPPSPLRPPQPFQSDYLRRLTALGQPLDTLPKYLQPRPGPFAAAASQTSPSPAAPEQSAATPPAQPPQPRSMLDTLTATGRSKNEAIDLAHSSLGIIAPSVTTFTPDASGTHYAIAPAVRSPAEVTKPYATYDAQNHRVVVQGDAQGGLGEPARHYLQNAANNKSPDQAPVYYPGGQEPWSATEVQRLHQSGEQALTDTPSDSPERATALAHAGLSPEAIQQQYKAGRLSYQQATALNQKFNGITEVNSTLHGGRQTFGAWANDPHNPRRDWWLNGTPEQKAVVINEYHDDLARKAQGNLHADPERIELLRRLALGDQKAEWKNPATPTPGQMPKDGPADFERIPLKDGSHTLMPGGRWTEEDLAKAHENPVFAKATQAERDAVMNDIIRQSFAHASARPGFDQAAYQRFHQTAQQARDKSAALKTWWDTGSDAYNFGGNVLAGVARPIIATATDSSLKDPNNEWRVPFGNVGEQAGFWGQQAKDLGQRWLPGSHAASSRLDSNLESLRQDLIHGNFPVNDRAKLEEWLAQRSKGLTEDQKGFYEAVQGKPDLGTDQGMTQHIYTHSNTLLHPANAELISKFMQTHDPAVWKELHQNLTRTPQRAAIDRAQNKSLEDSQIVNFMTNNYGGGDYAEHMKSAGNPIDIASNFIPAIRGLRAGTAASKGVQAGMKGTAAALAKSAAINLGTGTLQTLIDNPDANFADLAQAGKENIAAALGLHAAGHVVGKAKALLTDLNEVRKARQTIDILGAEGRKNTFQEAQRLHEAENTLAAAQKANLEKKKSVTGTLDEHESGVLDKANAMLARHAPRDRGPLPAIPDARRTIQDLSDKAAAGTLNADEAHGLAHAQRAISQQRVNDLLANRPLTLPQQRELDRFHKILAASPYGTELPKGPPPGYDPRPRAPIPGEPPRQHHEWHPPEGDKPVHPANDKFTSDALAIPESEIKATMDRLKANGHAHDRHGPEVTEGQLSDRAMHKVDPITQTKEDGEKNGKNHRTAIRSTQFTSERSMTQAVKAIENSNEYRDKLAKAVAEGKNKFFVENVSLESALGPDYLEHVRGRTRDDSPRNHVGHRPTILKAGGIFAHYKKDPATGQFYLNTMYPTHSPLYERN